MSDQQQKSDFDPWQRARDVLDSRAEQGWVFGVCATIARRSGWDLWAVRAVAIVALLLFWWIPVMFAYWLLAMLMDETRADAQIKMRRWAGRIDSVVERIWSGLKKLFAESQSKSRTKSETYSGEAGLN